MVVLIDRVVLRSASMFLIVAHLGAYWMCAAGALVRCSDRSRVDI